jgi:glycosyltransferase involved in cell wall biosynthesis
MIKGGADENTYSTVVGLNGGRYQVDLMVGGSAELDNFPLLARDRVFVVEDLVRDISPLKDLRALYRIYSFLKKNRYDIVHTHTAKGGIIGRTAARLAGVPLVVHTLHGTTFGSFLSGSRRRLYIALEKVTASWTDGIISVSQGLIDKYLGQKIGRPEQYRVVHSGFDVDRFFEAGCMSVPEKIRVKKELGLDPYDMVVVNVSRLEPRKGLKFFLESAVKIGRRFPQARFLIVGDGAYRGELEQEARRLGLNSSLIFTGPRQDVEKIIAISDVFVLTSLWEGLPRVLIQSAAVGKPIVTFDVEGANEVVEDGRNGYIVPSKDVEALTDKVAYLLEDLERAEQMGMQGRSIVGDAWRVEKMLDGIEDLYEELMDKRFANK